MTLALTIALIWALLATGAAVLLIGTIRLREHRHPAAHRADVAERTNAEWGPG